MLLIAAHQPLTNILISESLRPDVEAAFDIDVLENVCYLIQEKRF